MSEHLITEDYHVVSPAYGRDYHNKESAEEAFRSGEDWTLKRVKTPPHQPTASQSKSTFSSPATSTTTTIWTTKTPMEKTTAYNDYRIALAADLRAYGASTYEKELGEHIAARIAHWKSHPGGLEALQELNLLCDFIQRQQAKRPFTERQASGC